MEKVEEIFVLPANFGWSDLGTWGSLHEHTPQDAYGNACIGKNISVYDTHNCMIHTTQEKKVVIQGLDGFIVAEKNDTLLICNASSNSANDRKYAHVERRCESFFSHGFYRCG